MIVSQQYFRKRLPVQTLNAPTTITDLPPALSDPTVRELTDKVEAVESGLSSNGVSKIDEDEIHQVNEVEGKIQAQKVEAFVYVWTAPLEELRPEIWRFF